jgi:K+-transporting ATPase ATPase C chain
LDIGGGKRASMLIGQPFSNPRYFWSRPSAAGKSAYNPLGSSGSNLAPSNPALIQAVKDRVQQLRAADPSARGAVPVDLVTSSASGLDPEISLAAAEYQAHRVARSRGVSESHVRELIVAQSEFRTLGFLGEPRVHVLMLNLALDHDQTAAKGSMMPHKAR